MGSPRSTPTPPVISGSTARFRALGWLLLGSLLLGAFLGCQTDQTAPSRSQSRAQRFELGCLTNLVEHKALIPSLDHLPGDARRHLGLAFARTPQGPLYLDLYLPAKQTGPLPLIVWVHGGGWHSGPTARADFAPGRMVGRGYALASIDYRDSKVAPFPAQIQDCKAAVRWLRAHAREYGLDPDRFGAWGISAGGHLAALLGLSDGVKEFDGEGGNAGVSSQVRVACNFCGPSDFFQMEAPEVIHALHAIREATETLIGGRLEDHREAVIRANPATYADRRDPPLLILHGDADPLVACRQSLVLYEALRARKARVALGVVRNGSHLFIGPEIDRTVDAFFDDGLRR